MSQSLPRSPRLYNEELSPESATGTWKTVNLFNWWMSAWHSLGGYTMAIGLLVFGISGWQVIIAFAIGVVILFFVNNLTGTAGQRERVPFPVFARGAFGVFGANIPAILRAIVAIAWYGIQTWLASAAIMLLVIKIFPASAPLSDGSFLGLSPLGWICFLILSAVQLAVLLLGMEAVRHLSDFAGPTIWIAMFALAIWMLSRAGWSIDLSTTVEGVASTPGVQTYGMFAAVFLTVSYMAGPTLNFADFTRNAPSETMVRKGNALGLLINATAFGVISVVIAMAALEVYGDALRDPIHLMADIDSVTLLLVAIIAVSIATAGINIILNYVSPVYDIINVWPKFFTFKTSGAVVALLAVVILPWNLFSNPILVNQFIGGVGALMGPLVGIIVVDYYVIQGRHFTTADLFTEDSRGRYHYSRGYNLRAIAALAMSGGLTILVSVIPAFAAVAPFAWPIGVLVAGGVYLLLSRNRRTGGDEKRPETEVAVAAA